ncbi:hypothetical protein ABT023_17240 [Micromonospora sp. NPDC002296]|uniref:hypothetical protein n=1 Tax=Micromonospora sp. NPDC002296 TaxID=3154271 RepID=UPI00331CA1A5
MELDPESRLERLDALLQPATDAHDAFEQFTVGDLIEVDVNRGVARRRPGSCSPRWPGR